ncbi:DUF4003 domain-containing protein [Bacillus sp. BRMEA1]|uniref:DUF4003 family protein n=1 Tax=Neobacillus endophyticus TaxID=2738405 RepID=UPI001566C46F|nr:DUF4003 family protein [Neobacillus endophyticus]NRD77894.1 DUF4003 domain-containing protein [Neobacillus endophyticus]
MQKRTLKESLSIYQDIYSQLYSVLKWKADKRFLMLIAAMYATNSKDFSLKAYLDIADYIKENAGFFSSLKSAQRFTTAATLDTSTSDAKEGFHRFMMIYEKLIEKGFGRSVYTYISAGSLINVSSEQINYMVQRTFDIYRQMRKNHFFLTGSDDYPLAAILAQQESDPEQIIIRVEEHYKALQQKGFSIGNNLQFLSHILALDRFNNPEEKAEKCLQIRNLLKEAKLKANSSYYPYIGMLSFLKDIERNIESLRVINDDLNADKNFKWNKDVNFMISVVLLMNPLNSMNEAAKTGLNTSIEALIQAQQAAMTASMAAAAASNSSSTS